MAVVAVEPDGMPGPVRVAHLLPADEGRSEAAEKDGGDALRLPPGAITAPPRRRRPRRGEAEDVVADGERYRVFAPRPASLVDEDFLALIGALEEEFARRRERTRVAGKAGRAILVHVTTGPRAAGGSLAGGAAGAGGLGRSPRGGSHPPAPRRLRSPAR
jgi:hypothetical protein